MDWFNQVDATYRNDLRELNEQNFLRFDSKLEQRLTEFESRVDKKIAELRDDFRNQIAQLRSTDLADIRIEIRTAENRLLRWMFASWVTTIGTMVALLRLWG